MDLLKKHLAPISPEAWEEINQTSKDILTAVLTARKFVDVEGPKGLSYPAVPLGRLAINNEKKHGDVRYGLYQVQPLIEVRVPFHLDIWELDNIERGAADPDLGNLEKALLDAAKFEEDAIFKGIENIQGLDTVSAHERMTKPEKPEDLLSVISESITNFRKKGIGGPYSLVISDQQWKEITSKVVGYPLRREVEVQLGGRVLTSPLIDKSYVVTERGGDFILTLGQDYAVGFEGQNQDEVRLFVMESFTFRVIEPAAVVVIG